MTVNEAYNFRALTPGIDTAGVVGEQQLRELSQEGYTSVVNLLPEDSEYAVVGERGIVESQGIPYFYIPVDFSGPVDSDYQQFESVMASLPEGKALLHCAANFRVSAFASIYAYRKLGWASEEVTQFIADVWDIGEFPQWELFLKQWLTA